MIISAGFPERDRARIAALYWEAFGQKLGRVMGPRDRALQFFEGVLDPAHAICAHDDSGGLLGVAGFKTHTGALVGGGMRDMAHVYGWFGSLWRIALLALLERDTENDRFLMDGIFVAPAARGQGVGTALLDAIADKARTRGHGEVRLDVIDTNPRARRLYERQGFVAINTQQLGVLRHVFRFKCATTMVRKLN
ncbi:GNAT family N-acetyltransferase [Octadecabacter sp. R77987]|uniref:GNAT family N-acetyltransferase n=1 Tax=Octadecabacter sp. R77987 TaxID=3093874 RepID=UPI00366E310C